jgi:hypothetical protein
MALQRSLRGALAGGAAAALWAASERLDQRLFDSDYSDVELLGKAVTRGSEWPLIGVVLHVQNGMAFGAAYANVKPFLPGPPVVKGLVAGLAENFALWPLGRVVDEFHPARGEMPTLWGNRRALAQATFRHAVFGVTLGLLEHLLNDRSDEEPPEVPASSNGHGNIEAAVSVGVA